MMRVVRIKLWKWRKGYRDNWDNKAGKNRENTRRGKTAVESKGLTKEEKEIGCQQKIECLLNEYLDESGRPLAKRKPSSSS